MRPSGRVPCALPRLKAASPALSVFIDYKPVACIRLKVLPSGLVRISAPPDTPDEYLASLLEAKRPWIERKQRLFRETRALEKEDTIRTGTATRILGRQLVVLVELGKKKHIERDDSRLVVTTTDSGNQSAIDRQFRRWWRKEARIRFAETLERLYPVVGRRGIAMPDLRVARMRTMWGSCSREKARITLNESLFKAPQDCIDYVVLHELLHFRHPCHDEAFRTELTVHMPDWQKRKLLLDYEIVRGL